MLYIESIEEFERDPEKGFGSKRIFFLCNTLDLDAEGTSATRELMCGVWCVCPDVG